MGKITKKRDRLEIIHDLLKIIQQKREGIRTTPLLRYANLSSQSFKEYLEELQDKKLIKIEHNKKTKLVLISNKGLEYLQKYEFIKGFIKEFEL